MDFKWLRTFLLAAEELNYRKVAEQLFVTQPAVSLHIRQLEDYLGSKLFQKQGRHIQLTEFGKAFRVEANDLLKHYETVIQRVHRHQQGYSSTLSIAMTPLLVESLFPTILRKYSETYPHIEIPIKVAESADLQKMVEASEVDLAFSCLPSVYSSLVCDKVIEDTISLVTIHDGWDDEVAPPIDPYELLSKSIIFTDHHPVYWKRLKRDIQMHISGYRFISVSQSHSAKRFILEGMGVSFLPTFIIRREINEGRLLAIDAPFIELPTASIYALYQNNGSKEQQFVSFLDRFHIT
ncbi:LysR family transcriptional regulator [Halobacillus mangrovi]|uniref:LysR family transcriptional regulator n=1 Tax=Halobacillus mangrovi TaxID=402384 RepID=UPI003D95664A